MLAILATQTVFTICAGFIGQLVPGQARIRHLTDGTTFSLTPFAGSLSRRSPRPPKGCYGRRGLIQGGAAVTIGLGADIGASRARTGSGERRKTAVLRKLHDELANCSPVAE
jgi:hypothetical protein